MVKSHSVSHEIRPFAVFFFSVTNPYFLANIQRSLWYLRLNSQLSKIYLIIAGAEHWHSSSCFVIYLWLKLCGMQFPRKMKHPLLSLDRGIKPRPPAIISTPIAYLPTAWSPQPKNQPGIRDKQISSLLPT
ncbi:hypothetical protein GGS21DRAFT_386563 [Xylaria nigripes]|nr:hypothetical protein GGS21DRAFT_386563 [Xylaria nigripes]